MPVHDSIWYRISLWSIWVTWPGCVPLFLLTTPSLLTGVVGWEPEEALTLCKDYSAKAKTLVHLPTPFCFSQTQNSTRRKLTPFQPDPVYPWFCAQHFLVCYCNTLSPWRHKENSDFQDACSSYTHCFGVSTEEELYRALFLRREKEKR